MRMGAAVGNWQLIRRAITVKPKTAITRNNVAETGTSGDVNRRAIRCLICERYFG